MATPHKLSMSTTPNSVPKKRNRRRKGTPIDGIILLDKPLGMSSNQAVGAIKRLYGAQKVGHTGSLDPEATGVLPICLGEATKLSHYLLEADKGYYVKAILGASSSTGDKEGEIDTSHDKPTADRVAFEKVITDFVGDIQQVPPMYSALKHKGQPLYKLARKGIEVERKVRQVTILSIDVVAYSVDSFTLNVRCTKGTYIRTLVEDIAIALGSRAYVQDLRRTYAAPFNLSDCISLEDLLGKKGETVDVDMPQTLHDALTPIAEALSHWDKVVLNAEQAEDLGFGRQIEIMGYNAPSETKSLGNFPHLVAVFQEVSANSQRLLQKPMVQKFLGVGEIKAGVLKPKRLIRHPKDY